jgi:SAM-dependent methyltransferase
VLADHAIFDRKLLTRRRNRVAAAAASCDFLLERVAEDFAERLAAIRRSFPVVLNLGAHHGLLGRRLLRLEGVERVIDADLACKPLLQCSGLRVLADEEALPFRERSLDLVVSGLALQAVNDVPGALVQVRRALKPDGLLLAAVLGPSSLHELRQAWLNAEEETLGGASPRIAPFPDVRDAGDLLLRAGFALPVADSASLTVSYPDPLALMRELRAMGASNVLLARRRTPLRRATLLRAVEIYWERFGLPDGRVSATFEIVTMSGWAPTADRPRPLLREAPTAQGKKLNALPGGEGVPSGPAQRR